MDLYILNQSFEPLAIIDNYVSLIWIKRYYTCGDFELYMSADKNLLEYLKQDYFIIREDDDAIMVIEKIEITTDAENGDFFIISGRSAESLLSRRIIWTQTNIHATSPTTGIYSLIFNNAIGTDARGIPNLAVNSQFSISGKLDVQFTGDNLMEAISEICMEFGIGFKIALTNGKLMFSCYQGNSVDVTFSQEFDNLINSDYSNDYTEYKNCGLTAGEGEGTLRKTVTVWNTKSEPSGFNRREVFIDARDMSTNDGEIPLDTYITQLKQRGLEKLNEHVATKTFEGSIEPTMTYRYKNDYDLGDVVNVINEYGISAQPRIIEIIESWDENGYAVVPTFEEWEVN